MYLEYAYADVYMCKSMYMYDACVLFFFVHAVNCLDRHVAKYPDKVALIWEMNEQKHVTVTFR